MRGIFLRAALCGLLLGIAVPGTAQERSRAETAAAANLELGVAYLRQGNLAVAKEKLEKALKQNPRDANVHTALALLYEQLGEAARVDSSYRTALRLAPRNPEIQNNYAVYLCRAGRVKEGLAYFHKAATNPLYRTPEAAHTNAGVCQRSAKQLDEAEHSFARALAIRPNYAEAAFQFGDLQLERGRADDARQFLERYLGAFEATPDLLLLGARLSRKSCDRAGFERYARRLRMDYPNTVQAQALTALPPDGC
ncbi:MAG: type IV pilus biogenesis/stability protein PilW [Gammaproteobacteria bacterium]|nr:type IV pilus biogenesis/stability protein PilW [Gammaproteobacteria bacterium]